MDVTGDDVGNEDLVSVGVELGDDDAADDLVPEDEIVGSTDLVDVCVGKDGKALTDCEDELVCVDNAVDERDKVLVELTVLVGVTDTVDFEEEDGVDFEDSVPLVVFVAETEGVSVGLADAVFESD